jgi:hypothetical protein
MHVSLCSPAYTDFDLPLYNNLFSILESSVYVSFHPAPDYGCQNQKALIIPCNATSSSVVYVCIA